MVMFKTLTNYARKVHLQVNGSSYQVGLEMNDIILVELLRNSTLDANFILRNMPYIHSAYAIVLLEATKDT